MRKRKLRGIHLVSFLAALLTVGLVVPSAAGVTGEFRTLYLLATWGPTPFTQADAQKVAAETDAFFRASSSGRMSTPGSVAGPVTLPRSAFDSCDSTTIKNEAPDALFTGIDRVVVVAPAVASCRFAGEANPTEVLLNGQLYPALAIHELGHTFGLLHAHGWHCIALGCTIDEYGNPFSVMGEGYGDFNAYEKAGLDWLTGVLRPSGAGTHEIGPIEGSTTLPQALVVTTARDEFWFESRGRPTPSFQGETHQPAGVAVVAGPASGSQNSAYPRDNVLLPNPTGGRARWAYTTGEAFTQPEIFSVTVERHTPERATLRFEWLDRTGPVAPRVHVRTRRQGRIELSWDRPRERGSGVQSYSVVVDGRTVRTIRGDPFFDSYVTLRLSRGRHSVGVFATDRAGNRGAAAAARVRVR
jgi:Gametolysin peptidase M11